MLGAVPLRPRLLFALAGAAFFAWLGGDLSTTALAHLGMDELEREIGEEVARSPGDPAGHLNAARVHEQKREWDAALVELEVASERGADPDVVDTIRGRIFVAAGLPGRGKIEFDRVLVRRPDASGVLLERGRAWAKLGNADEAAADMRRAIASLPRPTPEQVIELRDVLLAAGRREDAVRALDAGMARVGRVASLQLAAVDLEVELHRYDDALRRIDELLAASPHDPSWVARRGEILQRAGRTAQSRAEYARALALIDARPAGRRGKPFEELRQRLATALAPAVAQSEGGRQ
ncbi:MAG: tetratricopeptide repeat protein [Candidatus Binatia bacterium]